MPRARILIILFRRSIFAHFLRAFTRLTKTKKHAEDIEGRVKDRLTGFHYAECAWITLYADRIFRQAKQCPIAESRSRWIRYVTSCHTWWWWCRRRWSWSWRWGWRWGQSGGGSWISVSHFLWNQTGWGWRSWWSGWDGSIFSPGNEINPPTTGDIDGTRHRHFTANIRWNSVPSLWATTIINYGCTTTTSRLLCHCSYTNATTKRRYQRRRWWWLSYICSKSKNAKKKLEKRNALEYITFNTSKKLVICCVNLLFLIIKHVFFAEEQQNCLTN